MILDPEDEAFNEIERQAQQRKESVRAAITKELVKSHESYDDGFRDAVGVVLQLIKELRPAIKPLEGMGKGKTTHEWFDILAKHVEELKNSLILTSEVNISNNFKQPQRTWVGLTDEELADCLDMSIQKTCRAIEAKLKEKNT
jgi:hypothetical protein